MLLLNAHTPCDDVNNDNEFKDILAEMQSHMVNHDNVDFVAFGGDLNTDISRDRSLHSVALTECCESECLAMNVC